MTQSLKLLLVAGCGLGLISIPKFIGNDLPRPASQNPIELNGLSMNDLQLNALNFNGLSQNTQSVHQFDTPHPDWIDLNHTQIHLPGEKVKSLHLKNGQLVIQATG